MRYKELSHGVEVCDEKGNCYGISKNAGQKVIKSIVLSRILLPMPGVLLPNYLILACSRLGVAPVKKIPLLLFNSCLSFLTCVIALPIAVSLFPNSMKISANDLEDSFKRMVDSDGKLIDTFIVSKGV